MGQVPKRFNRRQEAAYSLGLSVSSIDTVISDKRLTTRRSGPAVLIPAADMDRVERELLAHDMLQGTSRGAKERASS